MKTDPITIHVKINSGIFRQFALFDAFKRRRRWISPALFALILFAFSFICMMTGRPQATMIATVLQVIGVGLPLAYLLSFLLRIRDNCRSMGLRTLRPAYTLNFYDDRIHIINDMKQESEVDLTYDKICELRRDTAAFYLYVTPQKAFILPDGQSKATPHELGAFLSAHIATEKIFGKMP